MNENEDNVQRSKKRVEQGSRSPDFIKKLDDFVDKMAMPGPNEEVFFEERRKKGLGVGAKS